MCLEKFIQVRYVVYAGKILQLIQVRHVVVFAGKILQLIQVRHVVVYAGKMLQLIQACMRVRFYSLCRSNILQFIQIRGL
jgi:hypothetical protein